MMNRRSRNDCNLELGLFLPYDSDHHHHHRHPNMVPEEGSSSEIPILQNYLQQQQQPHKFTIFYDANISVSDVTELQAKSILMVANKRMEEFRVRNSKTGSESEACRRSSPTTTRRVVKSDDDDEQQQQQLILNSNNNSSTGSSALSMKRSLQRFLQKRKIRLQQTSPYN